MLFRTIFVCLFVLGSVELNETKSLEITFEIQIENNNTLVCDHDIGHITQNSYTVLEGQNVTLHIQHPAYINHLNCTEYHRETNTFLSNPEGLKNKIIDFIVDPAMGTLWNCTMLSHFDNGLIHKKVRYLNFIYSATFCYMKIHVRRKKSPQTILVNNMALQPVRTELSEKDIDLTAVYEYADGDVVSVTCTDLNGKMGQLNLEYRYAHQPSVMFEHLQSELGVGFSAKLHSRHHNSKMYCMYKESSDVTNVMVIFYMRTTFDNPVTVAINGMTIRHQNNIYHDNEYKYLSNNNFVLLCEVVDVYMKLSMRDMDLQKKEVMKKNVTDTRAELSLLGNTDFEMQCAADLRSNGYSAEIVKLKFTTADSLIDQCPLVMDFSSNGTKMEFYENYKRKLIYYEFEEGETLTFNCRGYCNSGPIVYLQFDGTDYNKNLKNITKKLQLTRKTKNVTCKLMEVQPTPTSNKIMWSEVIVIFIEKALITTSVPMTTETSPLAVSPKPDPSSGNHYAVEENGMLIAVAGGVVCIVIICVTIVILKLRKRNHSQGGPYDRSYENLQSQNSIPPYPAQWEETYAVSVDDLGDNATYSVPYRAEGNLYATPTPKDKRNKKKIADQNYASLDVNKSESRKNIFSDTDDPNYSEVCVKQEQCYAKVLPKSERNKQDNNPYSYVTNERAYVNTDEPLYCDPNNEPKRGYVNVANTPHYENSSGREYVEPTYTEPKKH